jgi:hypothetical protein
VSPPDLPAQRAAAWRDWLPEMLFLVVTTAAGLWAAGRWLDPTGDAGIWWSLPARISGGERYYGDLYLQYGPFSPLLLAAAGKVFGHSGPFVLLTSWVSAMLAGLFLLRVGRIVLGLAERFALSLLVTAAAVLAPGAARLVYPYCAAAAHALIFGAGCLLLLGVAFRKEGRALPLLAGALAGLAYCAKQEVGFAACLALASPLLTQGLAAWRWVAWSAFGAAPFVGAALLYAVLSAPTETLAAFCHLPPFATETPAPWRHVFLIASGLSGPNAMESIFDAARTLVMLASLVAIGALLLVREKRAMTWAIPVGLLGICVAAEIPRGLVFSAGAGAVALSTLVAFLVVLHAGVSKSVPDRELRIGVGLFAGLLSARTLFAGDVAGPYTGFAHFGAALTWCLFLFFTVPSVLSRGNGVAWARRAWIVIVVAWSVRVGLLGLESLRSRDAVRVETPHGCVWVRPPYAEAFRLLNRALRPGERVLVLPETHAIDLLFRVQDASPFLIHLPGWLDRRAEDLLVSRLAAAPPSSIVIFERPTAEFGVAPFGRGYGRDLLAWITARYRVSEETSIMQLWRPRDVVTPAFQEPRSPGSPASASKE